MSEEFWQTTSDKLTVKPVTESRWRRFFSTFRRQEESGLPYEVTEKPFRPQLGKPEVRLLGANPRVLVTPAVYRVMLLFVEISPVEVGWHGTVTRHGNDFLIDNVYLLKQDVSAATTDLTIAGRTELCVELELQGAVGMAAIANLRFWGHSHVRFPVKASLIDEATMQQFADDGLPWAVRGIFNKFGCASFSIFLFEQNLCIDDVQWLIVDEKTKAEIQVDGWFSQIYQPFGFGLSPENRGLAQAYDALPAQLRPDDVLRAQVEAEYAAKVTARKGFAWRGNRQIR